MEIKSLYIHIPFCDNICSYCDFCKFFYNAEMVAQYLKALSLEVEKRYHHDKLKTVYIGGGTPSCLSNQELEELFAIVGKLVFDEEYEFTFECNIKDVDEDLLLKLRSVGVNRLSIGVETINSAFFPFLNRYNSESDVLAKMELVKKYFSNINVDLMYAFPNETMQDLKNDLRFFKKLDVPHISIYSLILEKNTKLYIEKTKPLDENLESDMYYFIVSHLKELGYEHYEISNFSKRGYESKHNLTYWNNERYYGFGLSSAGYVANSRYLNTRSLNNYVKGNYIIEEEMIDRDVEKEYEIILGLRKVEGIDKEKFYQKFGLKIAGISGIIELVNDELLRDEDGHISIREDKLYLSNYVILKVLEAVNE